MKKNKVATLVLLSTFASSSLILHLNKTEANKFNINSIKEKIEATSEKIYDEVNNYFVQLLVQSRYAVTTDVVWVYGCSDKT